MILDFADMYFYLGARRVPGGERYDIAWLSGTTISLTTMDMSWYPLDGQPQLVDEYGYITDCLGTNNNRIVTFDCIYDYSVVIGFICQFP